MGMCMTIPGSIPLSYEGVEATNPPNVITALRAPTSTDLGYRIGTLWIDKPNNDSYQLTSVVNAAANWTVLGTSSSAALDVSSGGTGQSTLTNHGVLVGAGTSPITQLAVGATNSLLQGATGADPSFTTTPSVVQVRVVGGTATDFTGTATLAAGTVTVANTNIAATDQIYVTRQGVNASTAAGTFNTSISAGASFTITALNPTNATTQTGDLSTVKYTIFRQV